MEIEIIKKNQGKEDKTDLSRLKNVIEFLTSIMSLYEYLDEKELLSHDYSLYFDNTMSHEDFVKSSIIERRFLEYHQLLFSDEVFTLRDKKKFAKKISFIRLDIKRTSDNRPLFVFNILYFLGSLHPKQGVELVEMYSRSFEDFAFTAKEGTLGKMYRLLWEMGQHERCLAALKDHIRYVPLV